jgi:hypothetical protein
VRVFFLRHWRTVFWQCQKQLFLRCDDYRTLSVVFNDYKPRKTPPKKPLNTR